MGKSSLAPSLTMSLTVVATAPSRQLRSALWSLGRQSSLTVNLDPQIPSPIVLVIFLQRNRTNRILKELSHAIIGTSKSKIHRASWPTGDSAKSSCCSLESDRWKLKQNFYVAIWRQNCFCFGEPQALLLRPSIDWMKPIPIMEDNMLY